MIFISKAKLRLRFFSKKLLNTQMKTWQCSRHHRFQIKQFATKKLKERVEQVEVLENPSRKKYES